MVLKLFPKEFNSDSFLPWIKTFSSCDSFGMDDVTWLRIQVESFIPKNITASPPSYIRPSADPIGKRHVVFGFTFNANAYCFSISYFILYFPPTSYIPIRARWNITSHYVYLIAVNSFSSPDSFSKRKCIGFIVPFIIYGFTFCSNNVFFSKSSFL